MLPSTTRTPRYQWHSVQRSSQHISVTRTFDCLPQPSAGFARLAMVSASICGADVRIAKGDKDAQISGGGAVTMGHEGCGVIDAIPGETNTHLRPGSFVVVLPHVHLSPEHAEGCPHMTPEIEAACTSRHHTTHAGWDFSGVFTDIGVFPLENLVSVPQEHLTYAEQQAPELGRALFTLTEPLLCCLSAYHLMDQEFLALRDRELPVGRALVVGCGPIGVMHGIILAEQGYEVSFYDTVQQ